MHEKKLKQKTSINSLATMLSFNYHRAFYKPDFFFFQFLFNFSYLGRSIEISFFFSYRGITYLK